MGDSVSSYLRDFVWELNVLWLRPSQGPLIIDSSQSYRGGPTVPRAGTAGRHISGLPNLPLA